MNLFVLTIASFAFATAVQMTRGKYLNFKPFSCKFCLSFWFAFISLLCVAHTVAFAFINGLFVAGAVHFIKIIEDKFLSGGANYDIDK